nr:serine hydrolase [Bacteroidota bacterium]
MKSIKKIILVAITAFISTIPSLFNHAIAQTKGEKIDQLLSYCFENNIFNGSVLVAGKGKTIYKNVGGYSNLETRQLLDISTPICIGSISKQFTAMAIMMLKEQNKLAYEDKINMYFPELPGSKEITIRNLLNHTSGTIRYVNLPELRANGKVKPGITNQDIFEVLEHRDSLAFEPGTKYAYTNCGYIILSMIVEKVSGRLFHDFLNENIFCPLGMGNTFLWNELSDPDRDKATGYNFFGEKYDYDVFVKGAGGIYSTVEDLHKWDKSLYTEKLVSYNSLKEAFKPGLLKNGKPSRVLSDSTWGYGFGFLVRKTDSENITWHDGGFNGFNALFYRELNSEQCIIILSNKGGDRGISAPIYTLRNGILNILKNNAYVLPRADIILVMKNTIENEGVDSAITMYHNVIKGYPVQYDFSERQLNQLGYHYLNKNNFSVAISVFRLNVEIYPNYANGYDSLGEAYMKNKQKDLAILYYEKSLELNPDNGNAKEMLEKLKH